MAKVPAAGNVKTRLQPFLSGEQCAELAASFLRDTVNKIVQTAVPLIIAFAPTEKRSEMRELLPNQPLLLAQTGDDLGEKMFNAFRFAFSQNSDAVVMIGTDSPTFPSEFVAQAFEMLSNNDAVLGATADGGFYLIGLRENYKEIFAAVEWSSPETFEQTKANIERLDLKLALLSAWYDVDTPDDFERLRADLANDSAVAPETSEFVKTIARSKFIRF